MSRTAVHSTGIQGDRIQSPGEEIANAVSHGVALLAALIGAPLLILQAIRVGDAAYIAGVSVFCATMAFLYCASTIYHALPAGRAKQFFWVLDHAGIFLLIAGTWTPFTLGVLGGSWGWAMFGAIWGLAGAGVLLKVFGGQLPGYLSTGLYLAMGWSALLAVDLMLTRVPTAGLAWLVAGGVAYTLGVVFFATDSRVRYHHFIWHLFVMSGTACHFFAIYGYGHAI